LGPNSVTKKQPKRQVRPGVDNYGRSPLHYAAVEGNDALCRDLLASGADPNVQDDYGWAPLHFAAQARSGSTTTALLAASADPDVRDRHGNTPLFTDVFHSRGDGSVIALLRSAGASPHAYNNHGVSPVSLARTIANTNVARFFEDVVT